jgi:hypothetical protein
MANSVVSEKKSTIAVFYPILTHVLRTRELSSSSKLKEILIEGSFFLFVFSESRISWIYPNLKIETESSDNYRLLEI